MNNKSSVNNEVKKTEKNKKVNARKYVNCVLLMISIVLIAFIASKLYNRYQDNKLSESVFTRLVGTIQYEDIDSAIGELPSDGFILISYVKDEEVKKMESGLKKIIIDNGLQSNFYYLDATDLKLDSNFTSTLNEKFQLKGNNKIENLPALLYFSDGKHKKTITSKTDRMMNADDFSKLLDSYEIIDSK